MTRLQKDQKFIRYYKEVTGVTDVNMKEVAKLAVKMGWKMPQPKDPLDLLAKEFTDAARLEIRTDKNTGNPYRAYHSLFDAHDGEQPSTWIDIDDKPPRSKMLKSLVKRREQMIGDGLQLTFDAEHWNSICPTEEPIQMLMDFTEDIQWRMNAPKDDQKAS
jgi:hypothetical protein